MNKRAKVILFILVAILVFIVNIDFSLARSEDNKDLQVTRSGPDLSTTKPIPKSSSTLTRQATTLSPTGGNSNLIPNPSLEDVTSNTNLPTNWNKGGYGTNTRILTYPVGGYNSPKAIKVEITSRTNGDAKWYFDDIPVTPGHTYSFSDYYQSNVGTIVDVRYKLSDGTYIYKDIAFPGPASVYQNSASQFTVPANVISVSILHILNQVGYLVTDEYSLADTTPPPPDTTNLINNPGFETTDANNLPTSWKKGGWGTNDRTYNYPVSGSNSAKAANITISNYTSGDAKWYFTPISAAPGVYTYSDDFTANRLSTITIQYENNNGTFTYRDLAILSPANSFSSVSADFYVANDVKNFTVFHLISGPGSLTVDNVAVRFKSAPKGIFTTGGITLRFDDGWLSQYQNALPLLNSKGYKGTFFIISHQLSDYVFPAYMSKAQISDLASQGEEIGGHTQTHPYLTQLSPAQQQTEIQGGRQDLINMNVGPITSFAYPFGDYNTTTTDIVKNAGFVGAASSISGYYVTPTLDKYQLPAKVIKADTTVDQIKSYIDDVTTGKKWLILEIHEVNNTGNTYSITPANLSLIIDYIAQKGLPVVTLAQGLTDM